VCNFIPFAFPFPKAKSGHSTHNTFGGIIELAIAKQAAVVTLHYIQTTFHSTVLSYLIGSLASCKVIFCITPASRHVALSAKHHLGGQVKLARFKLEARKPSDFSILRNVVARCLL